MPRRSGIPDRPDAPSDALAALISHWKHVPERLTESVSTIRAPLLATAAQRVLVSADAAHRRSLVDFCESAQTPGLYLVLATLAGDTSASVAAGAQRALRDAVLAACPRDGSSHVSSDSARRELEDSVVAALSVPPEVRTRAVMLAALALLDSRTLASKSTSPLKAWFCSDDGRALSTVVSSPRSALARRRAWEWLKHRHLRTASSTRLLSSNHVPTPAEHETVLVASHLALNPARSCRDLGARDTKSRLLPSRADVHLLSPQALRGLARFAIATDAPAAARKEAAESLLTSEDTALRHSLTRAVAPGTLEDMSFDENGRVARAAFLRWSMAGDRAAGDPLARRMTFFEDPRRSRHLENCSRSAHPALRAFATQELLALTETPAVNALARMRSRRRLAREGTAYIRQLGDTARSGAEPDAIRAVLTLRRLSLLNKVEADLLTAAEDSTRPRLRATVASALGELNSPGAREAISALFSAADDRVRANAVEAAARAARHGHVPGWQVNAFLADNHHRIRANALRAAFVESKPRQESEHAKAQTELASMIADPRPMHRLAAAWLGARLLSNGRLEPLSKAGRDFYACVRDLAASDSDARTRSRAQACVVAADLAARTSWSTTTAPLMETGV